MILLYCCNIFLYTGFYAQRNECRHLRSRAVHRITEMVFGLQADKERLKRKITFNNQGLLP